MGNSNGRQSGASSPRHQSASSQTKYIRTFDGGSLSPNGIYPGQPDYNPTHVIALIRERRLAPFYKGLDDYEEEWTDYQLSCMVRDGKLPPSAEPPSPASVATSGLRPPSNSSTPSLLLPPSVDEQRMLRPTSPRLRGMSVVENGLQTPDSMGLSPNLGASGKDKRGGRPRAQTVGSSSIVPTRGKPLEVVVYRGAIECPVCFLFYPPNINRTRCCWKPICTECFVEMKRAEPHYPSNDDPDNPNQSSPSPSNINLNPMNLVSDPVRCPFCVKSRFGVVYNPPVWLPSEPRQDTPPRKIATSPLHSEMHLPMDKREEMYPPGHERVVMSDDIRPDWAQHLAHRRRVEARRLATATALQQALAVAGQRRNGRSAVGGRPGTMNGSGGTMPGVGEQRRIGRRVDGMIRITRDEADEMMLQEAIRQSLQTDEEERRKREEEEAKKNGTAVTGDTTAATGEAASSSCSVPRISTSPPGSIPSSPITASVLPRLPQSMATSPPSPRSFFSAFRARSGSGSSRSGTTPPSTTPPSPQRPDTRRPSSTTNLYPPSNIIRRQPSLPDALLTSTTASSLATAMHDSIIPGADDSRPSVSSPLASQSTLASSQSMSVPTVNVESQTDCGEGTPHATSMSPSSTIDEIVPVPMERVNPESSLKRRDDAGSVEQHELVEISN